MSGRPTDGLPNFQIEALVGPGGRAKWPTITTFFEGLWRRGYWTQVRFDATDFTAGGAMTWTLTEPDVLTYAYTLVGSTLTVAFTLFQTTVGGVPDTTLQLAIPNGLVAVREMHNAIWLRDNGVNTTGFAFVIADATVIGLRRTDEAVFTASANNTAVFGQLAFEVQRP